VETYRPRKIRDVILPPHLLEDFQAMVDKGSIPNLLLSGPAGIGKTTVARALLDELGYDTYVINGSLKGNIDTLRNEISDFASSVSFTGDRKCVLLDEADYLNPQSTQPALRNFMEEFSSNCGFILTCNYKSKIIAPLQSRCSTIDFTFRKEDRVAMAGAFFKRVKQILEAEGITYDPNAVGGLIKRHFPDWRRVLNELQRYSVTGKIDAGVLARQSDESFEDLIRHMRGKDFTSVRKWVGENSDMDSIVFFRQFYDKAAELYTTDSIPQLILAIGEYQYKAVHVADQEINQAAFLVYVMASCTLK
jgi:DNA polymerase III delta prime subunit